MEHIVAGFIRKYLKDDNVLSPIQHGFRNGLSTLPQLVSVIYDISEVLDASGQIDMLFFYFNKACDKFPPKIIYKLGCIGLPSNIISWIQVYLRHRQQFVEMNKSINVPRVSVT